MTKNPKEKRRRAYYSIISDFYNNELKNVTSYMQDFHTNLVRGYNALVDSLKDGNVMEFSDFYETLTEYERTRKRQQLEKRVTQSANPEIAAPEFDFPEENVSTEIEDDGDNYILVDKTYLCNLIRYNARMSTLARINSSFETIQDDSELISEVCDKQLQTYEYFYSNKSDSEIILDCIPEGKIKYEKS